MGTGGITARLRAGASLTFVMTMLALIATPAAQGRLVQVGEVAHFYPDPRTISAGSGLELDSAENLYVAETNEIQKLAPNGEQITSWPIQNGGPTGIGIDRSDNVYVSVQTPAADSDRIDKFTSDGQLQTQWQIPRVGNSCCATAYDVAAGPDGTVYVAWGQDAIYGYTPTGTLKSVWPVSDPVNVVVDADGYVYAVVDYPYRIVKFQPNGQPVTTWDSSSVRELALTSSGELYGTSPYPDTSIMQFGLDGKPISRFEYFKSPYEDRAPFNSLVSVAVNRAGDTYVLETDPFNYTTILILRDDSRIKRKLRVDGNRFSVEVECNKIARCEGRVMIISKARGRTIALAKARKFSIEAESTDFIGMSLLKAGQRRLADHGKASGTAIVRYDDGDERRFEVVLKRKGR